MSTRYRFLIAACGLLVLWAAAADGQTTAPATEATTRPIPEQPAVALGEGALRIVPEGCLGFVVVHNAKDFAGRVDAFVKRVGPSEEYVKDFNVLKMLTDQVKLGPTFDPAGGLIVVLLDPRKYAADLAKPRPAKAGKPATQKTATQPADDEGDDEEEGEDVEVEVREFPIALLLPGKDAMKMFEGHGPVKDGKDVKLSGDGNEPPWFCREVPGWVVLTPRKEVLDAFPAAQGVLGRLSAGEQAAIARNGAAAWVDFKGFEALKDTLFGAKFRAALKEFLEMRMDVLPFSFIEKYVAATRGESLRQAQSRVFAARIVEAGLVFEVRGRYPTDSLVGKALLGYAPSERPLMAALPNMPYIFAAGATKDLKAPPELRDRQIDKMLASGPMKKVPDDLRAKCRQVLAGLRAQMQSVQWYFGGVTTSQGQLGLVCVLQCQSPAEVKKLLRTGAGVVPDLLKALTGEDFKDLKIKYIEGLEKIDQTPADAITLEHPALDQTDAEARNRMRAILGDDKFRLLIAESGKDKLVITFGGGVPLLKEALSAASAGKGALELEPAAKNALAMLPKERVAAGLVNIGNAWNVIMNVYVSMGMEVPPAMRTLHAPAPIAGAFSIEKNELTFTVFVPSETIGALIRAIGAWESEISVPSGVVEESVTE